MDFAEVGETLGRNAAACRQLAARARDHVRAARPRFRVSAEDGAKMVAAFLAASRSGDAGGLARLLAEIGRALHRRRRQEDRGAQPDFRARPHRALLDVGRAQAAIDPVIGVRAAEVNGLPGFVATERDGARQTVALEMRDGTIAAIYIVRNPDKLVHIRI